MLFQMFSGLFIIILEDYLILLLNIVYGIIFYLFVVLTRNFNISQNFCIIALLLCIIALKTLGGYRPGSRIKLTPARFFKKSRTYCFVNSKIKNVGDFFGGGSHFFHTFSPQPDMGF